METCLRNVSPKRVSPSIAFQLCGLKMMWNLSNAKLAILKAQSDNMLRDSIHCILVVIENE